MTTSADMGTTSGLHHVTGITADVQANVDFYAGFLGLSLVKRTGGLDWTESSGRSTCGGIWSVGLRDTGKCRRPEQYRKVAK